MGTKNNNDDGGIMECMMDYNRDNKRKINVSKGDKHKATQVETKRTKKHTKRFQGNHLREIRIRIFDRGL